MRRPGNLRNSNRLLERIENLKNTPLTELSFLMRDLVVGAQMQGNNDGEHKIATFTQNILDRLPKHFGDRFSFDSYLIHSTLDSWSQGPVQLSNMVIPTYSDDWGHETPIFIPSLRQGQYHRIDLIRIPSEGPDDFPSLIDYPWLFHELAHYLISKYGEPILDHYLPDFNKVISRLKARAIADKGIAKANSNSIIEEISAKWIPIKTISEPTWLREIVVDVIALWTLGPAYLEAYEFEHADVPDPYLLEQSHPPVELRTRAMINAAKKLGWKMEVQKLEALTDQWKIPQSIRNKYLSLNQIDLIDGAINAAVDYCATLKIPKITPSDIDRIQGMIEDDFIPEESADIIIGAYLVYRKGETVYETWESKVYKILVGEIKP